jgi:hypothetical protein
MTSHADPSLESTLMECRRSLERGEYGLVIRTLEPLIAEHGPGTELGAELQLMLATAWMGQGDSSRAIACCRQLNRCRDAQLRAQARELLAVLEAPALERPREWSITLPELKETEAVEGRLRSLAGRHHSRKPPSPPPPPVGPTRPNLGFALLAAILLLLAVLLGGCVQVRGELHFAAPGRLQIAYAIQSDQPRPSPWQRMFGDYLALHGFERRPPSGTEASAPQQRWQSPVLPAHEALGQISADLQEAARLGGLEVPAPVLSLRERNLLLGVQQTVELQFDLTPLAGLKGLELALDLDPVSPRAVLQASPGAVQPLHGSTSLRWSLHTGEENQLKLRCWRWSALGLGATAVGLILGLSLILQTVRRSVVPGLPELPA